MNIPTFVISLNRSKDRREHIINEMAKHGVAFNFFDAFDGKKIEVSSTHPYLYDHDQEFWNNNPQFFVGQGVNALSLSHQALIKMMRTLQLPEILVFEDDAILVDGFKDKLDKLHAALPANYNFCFLQHCCADTVHCYKEEAGLWRGYPLCTGAMLYSLSCCDLIEEKAILGEPWDCLIHRHMRPADGDGFFMANPQLADQLSLHGKMETTLS